MEKKIWYAVLRDREDNDWGYGSFELDTAKRMARDMGNEAYIAVIDDDDKFCLDEIQQEDF